MSGPAEGRIAAQKQLLRAAMRERLAAFSSAERAERSRRACSRLVALPEVETASALLLRRSLPTEVDLDPVLAESTAVGRPVFVPRIDGDRLAFLRVGAETVWRRSTLGVLEPTGGEAFNRAGVGRGALAVVVPGLAFAPRGERLGRGGGHYDRALAELRAAGAAIAIAVAFDVQIVDEIPIDAHDARIDVIVTESRVIRTVTTMESAPNPGARSTRSTT